MNWIQWAMVLALGFVAGAAGAYLYPHWAMLRRKAVSWYGRQHQLQALARRLHLQPAARPTPARRPRNVEEVVVLIPDGRPWPLGPAVQLLELAWRWQVVHGATLPLRARQGEGAYVWRPPLPARGGSEQPSVEAER